MWPDGQFYFGYSWRVANVHDSADAAMTLGNLVEDWLAEYRKAEKRADEICQYLSVPDYEKINPFPVKINPVWLSSWELEHANTAWVECPKWGCS